MAELWTPDGYKQSKDEAVTRALSLGKTAGIADDTTEVNETRAKRYNNRKQGVGQAGDIEFATMRPRDPMFYWKQNNLPYEVDKPDELKKIRQLCRAVYLTNPVLASAIDIYSKYPLVGMELRCKDEALTEFYSDLFLEQLDYEEFLVDVLREYWLVGEAWPFGSFNELLGVWEDDELLNPDDIDVIRTPFQKEPRFEMKLPQTLRDILQKRDPKWEYEALMRSYPELKNFMQDGDRMPVSNVLLRQIKFKADTFNPRGVPIMLRGLRYIIQEEMLNSAQEAVASRLYMPLILAKLGATAQDLGTESPWIPTAGDLEDFEGRLDAALAADFRVLVHHFACELESVFGREVMPRLEADFDRITEKELQVFGLSKTLISGSEGGETYAGDALNRDLVSQLLTQAQKKAKRLFKERAMVVAEAQQHFDYDERNGKRYPIMEEVLEVDPETGETRIVEQPKLLVPELHLKTMNMHSEETEREFIETLRGSGIPISQKTRATNIPIDLDEERELVEEEQIENAVAAIRVQKGTYLRLRDEGLPIPQDLRDLFEPRATVNDNASSSTVTSESVAPTPQNPLPNIGGTAPVDPMTLTPPTSPEAEAAEQALLEQAAAGGEGAAVPDNVVRLPRNKARPPESDEKQGEAHSLHASKLTGAELRPEDLGHEPGAGRSYVPYSAAMLKTEVVDEENNLTKTVVDERAGGLQMGPRHIGIRRFAKIDPEKSMDEQIEEYRSVNSR